MKTLIQKIANSVVAFNNAEKYVEGTIWQNRCSDQIDALEQLLPSGSGFNSGTTISVFQSTDTKIIFETSFHHMNDAGFYTGWTDHKITITPSFVFGLDIKVGGRNKNDIKEYIADVFYQILTQPAEVA